MENLKKLLLLSILTLYCYADIQTGYIDMNQKLGNLDTINLDSNTICFTQIFIRPFKNIPKIATCLSQFDTSSQLNYQIEIRVRKIQLSSTNAKFIVLARSQISIWNRIVFSYFATDRQDIEASIVHLETQDVLGCGQIKKQNFKIDLNMKYNKLHVKTFINGFDIGVIRYGVGLTNFQLSVQVFETYQDSFQLILQRTTVTQIYSISIGYIATDPTNKQNFDYVEKTLYINSIQIAKPYIGGKKHGINLKNSQLMVGLQKFSFNYQQDILPKSLVVSYDQDNLIIASLDSTNLEYVQISFLVFKQKIKCKLNQIIVHKDDPSRLQCKQCYLNQNRVPNEDLDKCICLDGYYQIKGECYQLPKGGKWDNIKKTFKCNEGLTMTYSKENNQYKCKSAPKHKMWDSENQNWTCLSDYYQINNQCQSLPQNAIYNRQQGKFQCLHGYFYMDGICGKSYQNQQWSPSLKKFVCKDGFYRIKQLCMQPFLNSIYNQVQMKFICKEGYFLRQQGMCDITPKNMAYDYKLNKLMCEQGYYFVKQINACQSCPINMKYDQQQQKFICEQNHYLIDGICLTPSKNQKWSNQLKKFVCVDGTFRVKKTFCLQPKQNSYYSQITEDFQCNEGYYEIQKQCMNPPSYMKYQPISKTFICMQGYQYIDDLCIKIPQNKYWDSQLFKFRCVQNYYELEDLTCKKLTQNQRYIQQSRQIVCITDFVRLQRQCKVLPKNAKYVQEKEDFTCLQRYFRKDNTCLGCQTDCQICKNQKYCQICLGGFYYQSGTCKQECGDGKKFKLQCDDGNKNNDDGCSSNCQIQQGWDCAGGTSQESDKCMLIRPKTRQIAKKIEYQAPEHMEIKMVGMSHLYGKVILNVKIEYIPLQLLSNAYQLQGLFRILTNSQLPMRVSLVYIEKSKYTFVVLYDFQDYEPIPEYLTRIQMSPELKQKYYRNTAIKPLFIRINPAFMAIKDENKQDRL